MIGTAWNHPHSRIPPGTTPSKDWQIRLRHLCVQWRPSTRPVAETPGRHNVRISAQTMTCVFNSGTEHWVSDNRVEVQSWIDCDVLPSSTGLQHNDFPFSICLTQDFPRSNAVHTRPWPSYSSSFNPSSIGEGLHWLPGNVTWPTSIMPCNPEGFWRHPTGKTYLSQPIHARELQSSAWGTRFVTTIINQAARHVLLHRVKCHNKFCLANDDPRQFDDWTHTKQFLNSFHNYQISRWSWYAFFSLGYVLSFSYVEVLRVPGAYLEYFFLISSIV